MIAVPGVSISSKGAEQSILTPRAVSSGSLVVVGTVDVAVVVVVDIEVVVVVVVVVEVEVDVEVWVVVLLAVVEEGGTFTKNWR